MEVRWVLGRLPASAYRSTSDNMGLGGRRRRTTGSLGPREEEAAGGSETGSGWTGLAGSCVEEMPGVEPGSPSPCLEGLAPADPGSVFGSELWSLSDFSWNRSNRSKRLRLSKEEIELLKPFPYLLCLLLLVLLLLRNSRKLLY